MPGPCGYDAPAFYRRRTPRESPLFQLLEQHFDEFERVYLDRYQERYGFLRPVIRKAVDAFLGCGDLREGFARVRCPDCGHSLFVAFSCKQRCICPSCHQKRMLVTAINISENVAVAVPHRQFVFTMPKRFRAYFRYDRDLLKHLPRLGWETVRDVYRAVLDRDDVAPGMVGAPQTFGDLINWHPHLHALVTDGAFVKDGTFLPMPNDLAAEPFLKLWEHKIFALLLAEGRITERVVEQMRSWRHSGFSAHKSVYLSAGDQAAIQRLLQYMLRCPFSLKRMIQTTAAGNVAYRATSEKCVAFPSRNDPQFGRGVARNFEIFEPLDFIAEVTQHIPDHGAQTVRYYGWYSNKARGTRAKAAQEAKARQLGGIDPIATDDSDTPYRKLCRMRWAALIKRVYEVDPLCCPQCGGTMAIVSFIEQKDQADVIKRILNHCQLWDDYPPRAPPKVAGDDEFELEVEYVDFDEFLMGF
jgi:hypothetical protein